MKYNLHSGYNEVLNLTRKNNYKKATKLCKTLLKKYKHEENLWLLLIDLLHKSDCYTEIASLKKTIHKLFPANHRFRIILADRYSQYGYYDLAIDEYRNIISSGKAEITHYIKLASLLFHTRRYNAVITTLNEACNYFTKTSKLHLMLGASHHALQSPDNALIHYTKAYDIDSHNIDAITGIANIHFLRREFDTAITLLEPIISTNPPVSAIILYCQICTENKKYDYALKLIQKTLINQTVASNQLSMLYFESGKIHDALGNYETAFIDYKKGNDLINPGFNYLASSQYFENIKKIFTRDFIREHQINSASERLIFIVGMPRSGTSLVEQILASHPDIYGAGELNLLNDMVKQPPQKNSKNTSFPDCVINLSNAVLNEMAENYLCYINNINTEEDYITDKMPDNFQYLGLINLLFPQAKVIHCTRDPYDTCLSCYFQQFSGDYPYSYDLENLGSYYNLYQHLMNYWSDTLTIPVYKFEYETLVASPAKSISALLDFCSVKWDESCLQFNQTKRTVTTASAHQINQPLYKKSVNRWKNYQNHIQSLTKILDDCDQIT